MTIERIADPQQINLYAYTRNNPLAFIDPTGELITFANNDARRAFEEYLNYLYSDEDAHAQEIATVNQLSGSEADYRINLGEGAAEGAEGRLTTDGETIFINIANVGGPSGETFSINSRIAHELEHGRQFDNGEFSFIRTRDGRWVPNPGSYDIGDEVNAWKAQERTSIESDYISTRPGNVGRPTLLRQFSRAATDDEKAGVLARNGYPNRNPNRNSNVVFGSDSGYQPGQLVRTNTMYGRVNRVVQRR